MLEPSRYVVSVSGKAGTIQTDTASHITETPLVLFLLKKKLRDEEVKDSTVFDTKTSSWLTSSQINVEELDA